MHFDFLERIQLLVQTQDLCYQSKQVVVSRVEDELRNGAFLAGHQRKKCQRKLWKRSFTPDTLSKVERCDLSCTNTQLHIQFHFSWVSIVSLFSPCCTHFYFWQQSIFYFIFKTWITLFSLGCERYVLSKLRYMEAFVQISGKITRQNAISTPRNRAANLYKCKWRAITRIALAQLRRTKKKTTSKWNEEKQDAPFFVNLKSKRHIRFGVFR